MKLSIKEFIFIIIISVFLLLNYSDVVEANNLTWNSFSNHFYIINSNFAHK